MCDLHQQHADNLAAGGQDWGKAKVVTKDWAAMLGQSGIPLETMESLKAARVVRTDGTYVVLPETGS